MSAQGSFADSGHMFINRIVLLRQRCHILRCHSMLRELVFPIFVGD